MLRNVALWLLAAGLALLGVDRSLDRQLDREHDGPGTTATVCDGDGGGVPPTGP